MPIILGEAYGTIRLDASGAEKGAGQAKAALGGLGGATKTFNASFTEFNSLLSLGRQGLALLSQAQERTIGKTVELAEKVDHMRRQTGMSAEETSRLIQATDDLFISETALASGIEFAIRQGYKPSVAWFKQMADEVSAIPGPSDRAKRSIELFGRSAGPDLQKLLEQGSRGITEQMAAVQDGLVVTEEGIQKALAWKKALDDWNDSWDAFWMGVGQDIIGPATKLLEWLTKSNEAVRANYGFWQNLIPIWGPIRQGYIGISTAIEMANDETEDLNTSLTEQTGLLPATQLAYEALIGLTMDITSETRKYNEKMVELRDNQDELIDRREELKKLSWLTPDQKQELEDIQTELGNIQQSIRDTAEAHRQAALTTIFNLLQTKLAVGGLDDAEYDLLISAGVALGQFDEGTARVAEGMGNLVGQAASGQITLETFNSEARFIMGLPPEKKLTLITTYINQGVPPAVAAAITGSSTTPKPTTTTSSTPPGYNGPIPQAEGGNWLVTEPTLFLAGDNGPEEANFRPLRKAPSQTAQKIQIFRDVYINSMEEMSGSDWLRKLK